MPRLLFASFVAWCFALSCARPAPAVAPPPPAPSFRNVSVEGLGYVTGLIIHPDVRRAPALVYARTDVGGLFRLEGDRWIALLDATPITHMRRYQVESVAIDPGRADDVYIAAGDAIFASRDRGATWQDTALRGVPTGNASAPYRGSAGERLMIDPDRPGLLYFGSRTRGLWRRPPDGTWEPVTSLATANDPGVTFVRFGPTPPRTLYAGVHGSGVWASQDGAVTWTQVLHDPRPLQAAVASDGTLFVTHGGHEQASDGAVWRLRRGLAEEITPAGIRANWSGISVHPATGTLVVTTNHGRLFRSTDAGATWTPTPLIVDGRPPYDWEHGHWGSAALVLDPNDPSGRTAFRTDGFRVTRTRDLAAGRWVPVMRGLEELVVLAVAAPFDANGPALVSAVGDAVGFAHESLTRPPLRRHLPETTVSMGTSVAQCRTRPQRWALVGTNEVKRVAITGLSDDGGRTFRPFADATPGRGGIIVISAGDPDLLLWSPQADLSGDDARVFRSTNAGASWSPARGLPGPSFYRQSTWWNGQTLAADPHHGRTFYLLHQDARGQISFWISRDAGESFVRTGATFPGAPAWNVRPSVRPNPHVAGDLLVTFSFQPGRRSPLFRSRDAGQSFTVVPTLDQAYAAAFGRGVPGRPYLWAHGRMAGSDVAGIFRSVDDGASWHRITPLHQPFALLTTLDADLRAPDRIFIGTGGRGLFVYDASAQPPPRRSPLPSP